MNRNNRSNYDSLIIDISQVRYILTAGPLHLVEAGHDVATGQVLDLLTSLDQQAAVRHGDGHLGAIPRPDRETREVRLAWARAGGATITTAS